MHNNKYELTNESIVIEETKLYRIKALKDIGSKYSCKVKAGELGGYVESWRNLSRDGDSWIADNACVYGNAFVTDNATVYGNAKVYGDAIIADDASVYDNACVYGTAQVSDKARVSENAKVYDNANVYGDACVYGNAHVYGESSVCDRAKVQGKSEVYGNARVKSNMIICDGNIDSNDKIVYLEIDGTPKTFHVSRDNTIIVSLSYREINYFRESVRRVYDEPIAKAYLMMCDLVELKLNDKLK